MARKTYSTVIIERDLYLRLKEAAAKIKSENMQKFYELVITLVEKELESQKDPTAVKVEEKVPSTIQELWLALNERDAKLEQ